ncbi:MAG TPA: YdcH family protein [Kofleriaceae bacterium]|nr:YdcH family protein [Kofleriaceae bacterium]
MDAPVAGHAPDLLTTLLDEHRRLDLRLKAMDAQISLTAAERLEYAQLKKQKLATKDRIARLQLG